MKDRQSDGYGVEAFIRRKAEVNALVEFLNTISPDVLPVVEAALTIHLGLSVQIRTKSPGQWS